MPTGGDDNEDRGKLCIFNLLLVFLHTSCTPSHTLSGGAMPAKILSASIGRRHPVPLVAIDYLALSAQVAGSRL